MATPFSKVLAHRSVHMSFRLSLAPFPSLELYLLCISLKLGEEEGSVGSYILDISEADPFTNIVTASWCCPPSYLCSHCASYSEEHVTVAYSFCIMIFSGRSGWPLHTRHTGPAQQWPAYPTEQKRWRHAHCLCCPPRLLFLNALGSDALGVSRGIFPSSYPPEGDCFG